MKLTIVEKGKKDIFVSLFQLLKNCSSAINIIFNDSDMYIQGMDKAHVCLFDIKIMSSWFDKYEKASDDCSNICIPTPIVHNILSIAQESQSIVIYYEGQNLETINIDLLNEKNVKGEVDKFFKVPLVDLENELLSIPDTEYDAEITMNSKKVSEIITQLLMFGDIMNIKCSEESIYMGATGQNGDMHVSIPIDDLSEFSINEGDMIDLSFGLNNICKMCMTTKLSSDIKFSISKELPMKIEYDLGSDSHVTFFVAPKMTD